MNNEDLDAFFNRQVGKQTQTQMILDLVYTIMNLDLSDLENDYYINTEDLLVFLGVNTELKDGVRKITIEYKM